MTNSVQRWGARLLVAALTACGLSALAVPPQPAAAIPPFPIDSIHDGDFDKNEWFVKAQSGAGALTSDNWFRLTTATSNQSTALVNRTHFPSGSGFELSFDYRMAAGARIDGKAGDGISVYLIDAFMPDGSPTPIQPGGAGAGLGYARHNLSGNDTSGSACGVRQGYLGLGLDAFGNYASNLYGSTGADVSLVRNPPFIGLRGSGSGDCQTGANFPWVTGARVGQLLTSDSAASDPAWQPNSLFRAVVVRVQPKGQHVKVTALLSEATTKDKRPTDFRPVFSADLSDVKGQADLPENLQIGFGASTGAATSYQDIRNVKVAAISDLAVTKTLHPDTPGRPGRPAGTFFPGDPIAFEVTARNNGPTAIDTLDTASARVADDLSGLPIEGVRWTCTAVGGATCLHGAAGTGSQVVQDWGGPIGSSVRLRIDGTVTSDAGTYENTAVVPTDWTTNTVDPSTNQVQSDGGAVDQDLSNNAASASFTIRSGSLVLTKSASPNDTDHFVDGQELTYSFTVTNDGPMRLTDVTIDEVSFTGQGQLSSLTYRWPDSTQPGTLLPGAKATAQATYTISAADVQQGSINNTARARARDPVGNAVQSPSAAAKVSGSPAPALVLTKTADTSRLQTPARAGDQITYTMTARNTGNVPLFGVFINDKLAGLTDVRYEWPGPPRELGVGESVKLIATYALSEFDVRNRYVHNEATAVGIAAGNLPAAAKAAVDTALVKSPLVPLHIRQLVVNRTNNAVEAPQVGYFEVRGRSQTFVGASGIAEVGDTPFTEYAVRAEPSDPVVEIAVIVPQYYELVGYAVTLAAADHGLDAVQPGWPQLELGPDAAYWVTVFIQPRPVPLYDYQWGTRSNDLGLIA